MSHHLEEIEAIRQLKYRYLRHLDSKQWDEMARTFTEDAACNYSGGQHKYEGRDAIMSFLKEGLPNHRLSMHHCHHPEIEITSETTAKGTWALEDYLIDTQDNFSLHGAAFYHDEYVKVNGEWKIKFTGYDRVFEEFWMRSDIPSLNLTKKMF